MSVIIYARVSTKTQSTDRQIEELKIVAEKSGWDVIAVLTDQGISGSKGRKDRPALDEALKMITQRKADRLLVWSIDRLGRSLQDLIATLNEIQGAKADLYIHQQAIDTRTPAGAALFGMLGVFATFEKEIIRERVISGLENAKRRGVKLGRKAVSPYVKDQVIKLRTKGLTQVQIAKKLQISQPKVSLILKEAA